MLTRPIPSTNEEVPVIGLGTWQTSDVGAGLRECQPLIEVLRRFSAAGGTLIDTSPMYGRADMPAGDGRLLSEVQRQALRKRIAAAI